MSISAGPEAALDEALRQLQAYRDLEPDWDSCGADPVTEQAVHTARRFLLDLARVPDAAAVLVRPYLVAPLADGGVQLEWRGPAGAVEVEIGPAGETGYVAIEDNDRDRQIRERDDVPLDEVREVVLPCR